MLRHGGQEQTFAVPTGKKKCTFVAHFADVEHEVKPVNKGRRVSLLYNLHRLPRSETPVCPQPDALSTNPVVQQLVAEFEKLTGKSRSKLSGKRKAEAKKIQSQSTEGARRRGL